MITELLLLAANGTIDPMNMSGFQMYPSGVKECDKYPRYAPKTTNNAVLALPVDVIDKDGNFLPSGHYQATISIDQKNILVFDNNNLIKSFAVTSSKELEANKAISVATYELNDLGEGFITLIKGKYRYFAQITHK